uniref:Riboflavin transporter n=1 Tax=Glossina austeni TaxID=7395 RepID=A0A1A9VYC8_GLOAU
MSSINGDKQASVNVKNFNQDQIDSTNDSQENTTQPACSRENAVQPKIFTSSSPRRQSRCTLKFDIYNKRSSESSEVSSLLNNGIKMRTKLNLNLRLSRMLKERSLVVDMLAIFFGIGTWVGINGTFIQLPLLVEIAPEGWSLPSYLSVMVQIGNLGPLLYTLLQNNSARKDTILIYGLLTLGTISALLSAFFYSETAVVFGQEHSVALFVLTFLTAINACSSSVLFMPYMGRFKEIYLVTYFVGEGLSGLLPSVVALIQGIGTTECILTNTTSEGENIYEKHTPPPLFDTKVFFIFIFAMMVLSCGGFFLLDRLKLAKDQYANVRVATIRDNYVHETETKRTPSHNNDSDNEVQSKLTSNQYVVMLFLIAAICFFANASFLTIYVLVTAAMSPTPPLYDTAVGKVLVIFIWTLLIGLVSYIKLSITTVMHSQGGKSLVWTGCVVQVGSLVGSLIIFVLINFTGSFKAAYNDNDPC